MLHRLLLKLSKFDVILPLNLIPWMMMIGSTNLTCTITSILLLLGVAVMIFRYLVEAMPKFFLNSVVLWLVLNLAIYEFISVETLMVYPEENYTTLLLTAATCFCMFQVKRKVGKCKDVIVGGSKPLECAKYCNYCEIYTPEHTQHKFWLNSCIIPTNKIYYFFGLCFGLWALLYTSNLILVTLCEPLHLFWGYYLPKSCGGVYFTRELSLTYLCGVQQTLFSVFILFELILMLPCKRCRRIKK